MKKIILTLLLFTLGFSVQSQSNKLKTIDGLIESLYNVISGPKGDRDWEAFHQLYHPDAIMGATLQDSLGQYQFISFTPKGYQKRNQPFFEKNNFYEEEIEREIYQYGGIAMVSSSYQFKFETNGPVIQKGVNHIQLVKEDGRWWITSLIWEAEE